VNQIVEICQMQVVCCWIACCCSSYVLGVSMRSSEGFDLCDELDGWCDCLLCFFDLETGRKLD
jgi:hypothetical protein